MFNLAANSEYGFHIGFWEGIVADTIANLGQCCYSINSSEYLNLIEDVQIDSVLEKIKLMTHTNQVYVYSNMDYSHVQYMFVNRNRTTYIIICYKKNPNRIKIDSFFSSSSEIIESVRSYIKTITQTHKEQKIKNLFIIDKGANGWILNSIKSTNAPLIRDNYDHKVLYDFDRLCNEFNKSTPHGRLGIISGPPGTGKTWLLKGFVEQNQKNRIIILPSRLVGELDGPGLVSLIKEQHDDDCINDEDMIKDREDTAKSEGEILFIVEDADECVVPRGVDNMSTISSLLNYTDGILGASLNLRVLLTTNADHLEFDRALMRPGRICCHIFIDALSPEHASEIYQRLTDKIKYYKDPTTLAGVYADAFVGSYENYDVSSKKLGFGT